MPGMANNPALFEQMQNNSPMMANAVLCHVRLSYFNDKIFSDEKPKRFPRSDAQSACGTSNSANWSSLSGHK